MEVDFKCSGTPLTGAVIRIHQCERQVGVTLEDVCDAFEDFLSRQALPEMEKAGSCSLKGGSYSIMALFFARQAQKTEKLAWRM